MGAAQLLLKELLPLDLEKFPFILSLMVRWIQIIFGIQIYHEGMQVKFKYVCGPIIIWGSCIFIHLQLPQNCWNDFTKSW
jgi:hypothetical protein